MSVEHIHNETNDVFNLTFPHTALFRSSAVPIMSAPGTVNQLTPRSFEKSIVQNEKSEADKTPLVDLDMNHKTSISINEQNRTRSTTSIKKSELSKRSGPILMDSTASTDLNLSVLL